MAKKIHQNSITGQRGVNLIEEIVLKMGFIWYPTPGMEAGIDGIIEIRNPITGAVYNHIIQVQSKATSKRFAGENDEKFHFICDEKDLQYWLEGNAPVILIVSRPDTGEAYWVSIKSYFKKPERRSSRKVVFDKKLDRFDDGCAKALMDLASKPETTVVEDWQRLQTRLDDLDPYYRVVPTGVDGWNIQGKYPGVEKDHPLKIAFDLSFPNTTEGKEILEKYQQLVKTGTELKIPQQYISDFRLPEFMKEVFDFSKITDGQLILRTHQRHNVLEVDLDIECDDGERAALTHIKLDLVRHGTDEALLDNSRQRTLWLLELIWRIKEHRAQINFKARDGRFNVKSQLEWLKCLRAYSKGGELRLVNSETGVAGLQERFPSGLIAEPDPEVIRLVEKVFFIQSKTGVPLSVPERLTPDDVDRIIATERILKTGKNTFSMPKALQVNAMLDIARMLLEIYEEGMPARLDWHWEGGAVVLLGATIDVGQTEMYCERTYLAGEDHEALKKFVASGDAEGTVPVAIRFVEDSPIHASYPQWLPPEQG